MSTIIIAANLGHFKAYRLMETPTRGPKLDLVEEVNFLEAHGRFVDKVTDQAGRFPVTAGAGPGTQMSPSEDLNAEQENERRLTKLVAEKIEEVIQREQPEYWRFAATSEIQQSILREISPEIRERLVRAIPADLTKTPVGEVLEHFAGAGP